MTNSALDIQDEAVKRFFLSLPADPQGTLFEVNGRTFRVQSLSNGNEDEPAGDWTDEKNARRCILIDREIDGTLTPEEAVELHRLQREMLQHRRRVAPLPLEDARKLHQELLAQAQNAPRE